MRVFIISVGTITMRRDLRYAGVAVAVLGFWFVAAAGVATADRMLQPVSAGACLAAKIGVIGLIAGVYMRIAARDATIEQALLAGIAWTLASVAAELLLVSSYDPRWYPLFGPPTDTAFRNILLIAWIGSTALFARRRE